MESGKTYWNNKKYYFADTPLHSFVHSFILETYIHAKIHINIGAYTNAFKRRDVCPHLYTHGAQINIYTYIQVHTYANMYTYMHTYGLGLVHLVAVFCVVAMIRPDCADRRHRIKQHQEAIVRLPLDSNSHETKVGHLFP